MCVDPRRDTYLSTIQSPVVPYREQRRILSLFRLHVLLVCKCRYQWQFDNEVKNYQFLLSVKFLLKLVRIWEKVCLETVRSWSVIFKARLSSFCAQPIHTTTTFPLFCRVFFNSCALFIILLYYDRICNSPTLYISKHFYNFSLFLSAISSFFIISLRHCVCVFELSLLVSHHFYRTLPHIYYTLYYLPLIIFLFLSLNYNFYYIIIIVQCESNACS